jgi:glyoxylase-like metal-dependent hydrolase (beta-lactamase superfamily II)
MKEVWTRRRAGTAQPLLRSPVPDRPQIHQIVLPLPFAVGRSVKQVQIHLIEGEPLTLVDTGLRTPESRAALESALEELGYGMAEIERVVITHAHADHMGLVQSIREAGASLECWVHEADAQAVEAPHELARRRAANARTLWHEFGVPESVGERLYADQLRVLARMEAACEPTSVERALRQGDRVEFKDFGLLVHHSPGHTPGHLLLEDEELGLLFTGDQVMAQAIPEADNHYLDGDVDESTGSSGRPGAKDTVEAAPARPERSLPDPGDPLRRRPRFRGLLEMRKSLRRLRGRRFKCLLPASGGVILAADRAIRDTLLFYDVRLQRIDRGLRHLAAMGQDVTAFEIWSALFPKDEPPEVVRAHMLLLIGALDCLEDEGKLETLRRDDGVLIHHHR